MSLSSVGDSVNGVERARHSRDKDKTKVIYDVSLPILFNGVHWHLLVSVIRWKKVTLNGCDVETEYSNGTDGRKSLQKIFLYPKNAVNMPQVHRKIRGNNCEK